MGIFLFLLFALILALVIIARIEWKSMERRLHTYENQIKTNAQKSELRERELHVFIEDLKRRNQNLIDLRKHEESTRTSTETLKQNPSLEKGETSLRSNIPRPKYENKSNQGSDRTFLKEQERRKTEERKEQFEREQETRRLKEEIREEKRRVDEAEKQRELRQKELEKIRQEVKEAIGKEKTELQLKVQQIEQQLGYERRLAAQNIENLNQQLEQARLNERSYIYRGKSGYIGILSNPGSFGNGIYRIGLTGTGRTEPKMRYNFPTVPFPFIRHAMIPCEDAAEIERLLHIHFQHKRVNEKDSRKKFFRVSLDEIEIAMRKVSQETKLINEADIKFEEDINTEVYYESFENEDDSEDNAW